MNEINHSKANQMAGLEAVSKAHIRQMSSSGFLTEQTLRKSLGIADLGVQSQRGKKK